jgi:RNA polymerase sigma-70 factor, ECF subfamily
MFSIEKHYPLYNKQVYEFIYFLTFNETLAEDLLQETFLRAYKARNSYRGDANVLTWLRKIAKNVTLDHLKSKKIYFWHTYKELSEKDHDTLPSAEQLYTVEESKRALYSAIAKLKLDYRLAIILRKIEELSIAETAAILDWNESKVKNNTERGMKALRELMKGDDQNG